MKNLIIKVLKCVIAFKAFIMISEHEINILHTIKSLHYLNSLRVTQEALKR